MKRNLRYITILVGCLLAVVIVCSQVYTSQIKVASSTEHTDDSSDESQGEATFSMASFSLPSPLNVQINLDPHFLFEIVFESVTKDVPQTAVPSIEEKFFTTLFRVIISPNAP
jgi:hypothetical protein